MKQSVFPLSAPPKGIPELPQNCWRVVVAQTQACQQQEVHQQASALMLVDLWIRRSLKKICSRLSCLCFGWTQTGKEHLLVETHLPELLPM